MVNYVCVYSGVRLASKSERPQHDRPVVCYPPVVFFRHLRLAAFIPERKNTVRMTSIFRALKLR
jgi:hypothetical protein